MRVKKEGGRVKEKSGREKESEIGKRQDKRNKWRMIGLKKETGK